MITYKFTIQGEIAAANATEAYDALSEVLTRIADDFRSHATRVELAEEFRITLEPLHKPPDWDVEEKNGSGGI
ncbi:MAG: hypothetical protein ACRDOU_14510 [Streptosporangiaceae bacterium]